MMATKATATLVGALTVLGAGAIGRLLIMPSPPKDSLDMEIAKGLIQLLLVSVVGVTVSILVFEYQRNRQLEDKASERSRELGAQRAELIKDLLSRAVESYAEIKRERRLMRARGVVYTDSGEVMALKPYDTCMEAVSDAQLKIEGIRRDIQTTTSMFAASEVLVSDLQRMDSYIGSLISEFERSASVNRDANGDLPMSSLPQMDDFLRSFASSGFGKEFAEPFRQVLTRLRIELLGEAPRDTP